jgi:hypothetical protein
MLHASDDTRPVEILLVEDNPDAVRLTIETMREGKVANRLKGRASALAMAPGSVSMSRRVWWKRTAVASGRNQPDQVWVQRSTSFCPGSLIERALLNPDGPTSRCQSDCRAPCGNLVPARR